MYTVQDSVRGELGAVVLSDRDAPSCVTVVPERGALIASFVARGREWLYLDEATLADPMANVRGGIPVLFPSPGKLDGDAFTQAGKSGKMRQHGFARSSAFAEVARGTEGSAWVELELVDGSVSKAIFPFGFRLRLRYTLRGPTLHIGASVLNTGDGVLPFALGYHPYFAVAVADKRASNIPTSATRAWDNVTKREVALGPIELSGGEVDLHLIDHGSNNASLQTPQGSVELDGDFAGWVVWTLPSRDFVCLEPWSAPANAMNTGENLCLLSPGAERRLDLSISVRGVESGCRNTP